MEIRYEELSTTGVETLKSVFDFCGLPANSEEVAAIVEEHQFERMKARRQHADKRVKMEAAFYRRGKVGSWQEELNSRQRYIFDQVGGDLLSELGYAEVGWWADSRLQQLLVPALLTLSSHAPRWLRRSAKILLNLKAR